MQERLQALIVDDELPSREELRFLLEKKFSKFIEIVGEAEHGWAAVEKINKAKPQIVFLDVQMPGINGLEVAQIVLEENPDLKIIFITAYDDYAIKAFEVNAFDYLVKPFNLARLEKTILRLHNIVQEQSSYQGKMDNLLTHLDNLLPKAKVNKIPCEEKGKIFLIDPEEIYYCSVDDGKVFIVTKEKKLKTFYTLNELEKRLNFFRAHRSYLVNLDYIKILEPLFHGCYELILDDISQTRIPVSRIQSKKLRDILEL